MTAHIKKGFTLIELLIVMAILGVLAVVVLVAINPAEQLARTRDTGRVSAVTQMGHAVQAYYTSHNAVYPPAASWSVDLTNSGEVSIIPASITYPACGAACTVCTGNIINGNWCYLTSATDTIVFAKLESRNYNSKCGTTNDAFVLYSTGDGRGGTVCTGASGTSPAVGLGHTFVQ